MAAVGNPDVAFVVMMAGPGVPGDEILQQQVVLIGRAAGKSQAEVEKDAAIQRDMLAVVKKDDDDAALDKDLRAVMTGKVPDALMGMQIKMVSSPWFRDFVRYDPAADAKQGYVPFARH